MDSEHGEWVVRPECDTGTHRGERGGQQEVCDGEHEGGVDRAKVMLQSVSLVHLVGLGKEASERTNVKKMENLPGKSSSKIFKLFDK